MDKNKLFQGLLDIYANNCMTIADRDGLLSDLYSIEAAKNTVLVSYRSDEKTRGVRDGVDSMILRKYKDLYLKYYGILKNEMLDAYFDGAGGINTASFLRNYEAMMRELYLLFVDPLLFSKHELKDYAYGGLSIQEMETLKARSRNTYYAYHDFMLKLRKENSYSMNGIKKYIAVELEKHEFGDDAFLALTPAYLVLKDLYMSEKKYRRLFTKNGIQMGSLLSKLKRSMKKSVTEKKELENGGFDRLVIKYTSEPSSAVKRIYFVLSEVESEIEEGVYVAKLPEEYSIFCKTSSEN